MIFGIFILIGLISVICAIVFKNKLAIIGSLAFIILSVIIPVGIYSSNIGKIADLQAFYNASATNFQIARDDTASYLSEEKIQSDITLIPIYGSIERTNVGANAATRILEYRNSVNAYNTAFAKYKAYKNSFLYGIAYPEIPSEMKLLIINPVQNESPNNIDEIQQPDMSPVDQGNTSPGGEVSVPKIDKEQNSLDVIKEMIKELEDKYSGK